MQSTIPTDTRRTYVLIGGLDMAGLACVAGGVMAGLGIFHSHVGDVPLRIFGALIALGIGAALGWGKWPMEDTGDRIGVWALRLMHFFLEEWQEKPYFADSRTRVKRRRSHG